MVRLRFQTSLSFSVVSLPKSTRGPKGSSSKVTDWPCLKLVIVKGVKGITHDLRRTEEVVGSCERHAKYET